MGEIAGLATTVIDKIWPNKSEQEKAELQAALVVVQGQLAVNQPRPEAAACSLLAGGRFIGWVPGAACAWNWIGLPIAEGGAAARGAEVGAIPADLGEMLSMPMGMLGLGPPHDGEDQRVAAMSD